MAARELREPMHDYENKSRQYPVCVVKNKRKPRQHRRGQDREHRDGENEEGDWNYNQVGKQRNRGDEMKIPEDERQRAKPGRERDRSSAEDRFYPEPE